MVAEKRRELIQEILHRAQAGAGTRPGARKMTALSLPSEPPPTLDLGLQSLNVQPLFVTPR
jgi:hypothetical protein